MRQRAGNEALSNASWSENELAIKKTYEEVANIHFDGMHYRKDIGRKGLKRW